MGVVLASKELAAVAEVRTELVELPCEVEWPVG